MSQKAPRPFKLLSWRDQVWSQRAPETIIIIITIIIIMIVIIMIVNIVIIVEVPGKPRELPMVLLVFTSGDF